MSGDTGRPSSSDVAHEAEDTRAHLASTLEQLRNNLRPENVMEEVVSNARIGASTVADNLLGVAKQYPIPSLLIATGSALLMSVFARRSAGPKVTGFEALDASRSRPGRDGSSGGSRPPQLRNPSSFAPGRDGPVRASLGESLADAKEGIADAVSSQTSALKRKASHAYDSTTSQAGDAMQNLSRYLPHDRGEVKSKLSNLLDEQPLILGAIGLAIGAAIGAALPMTETEDSLMGSTAHRLREGATDAARHEIDGLRHVASEAVGNVRHSASENLQDFVKDVSDNARTVVGKAGDTLSRDV